MNFLQFFAIRWAIVIGVVSLISISVANDKTYTINAPAGWTPSRQDIDKGYECTKQRPTVWRCAPIKGDPAHSVNQAVSNPSN